MSHDQPLPDPRLRSVEPKSLLYILTLSSTSHKNLAPVCYSFETRPEMVNAGDAAKPDVDASLFPFRIFIPLLLFFPHYSMTETASGVARCYCRLCEKSNGGRSTRCRRVFVSFPNFYSTSPFLPHCNITEMVMQCGDCYCRLCEKSNGGRSTRCRDRDWQKNGLGASKKDGQIRKMQVGSLCCPDRGSGFIFSCFPDAGFPI